MYLKNSIISVSTEVVFRAFPHFTKHLCWSEKNYLLISKKCRPLNIFYHMIIGKFNYAFGINLMPIMLTFFWPGFRAHILAVRVWWRKILRIWKTQERRRSQMCYERRIGRSGAQWSHSFLSELSQIPKIKRNLISFQCDYRWIMNY